MRQRPWIVPAATFIVLAGAVSYFVHLRAENERLENALREAEARPGRGDPTSRPPPPGPAEGSSSPRILGPEKRSAMLETLRRESAGQVWFATSSNDGEAAALQRALQSVFEEAGWTVNGNVSPSFMLKPGIYLFTADEESPAYVETALAALDAAGLAVTSARGYRAFYEEKKKADPTWSGFDLKPAQAYLLVIGPNPPPS